MIFSLPVALAACGFTTRDVSNDNDLQCAACRERNLRDDIDWGLGNEGPSLEARQRVGSSFIVEVDRH